ncbi:hypothetical protein [Paenibacillus gansuensis]|uniref:Sporulation membrane protein YtrI C-terminal domain-containing protein n=1 Tax=Paenibacillus gansuensis TaxID=306542 RepID=A0ABW5PG49_9BACL
MRVPSLDRFAKAVQMMSIFLCGVIVGCAVFNSFFHKQMEKLMATNNELWEANRELRDEVKISDTYKNKQVISKIVVRAENSKPTSEVKQIAQEQIKKKLQSELGILRGNSIYEIDRDAKIASLLLNKKRYTVEQKDYEIEIKTMLLVDKVLHIWITVAPYIRN